ncbi:iron-responsive transcriptional regulator RirA [Aureimonas psammosilenae]|uniref:iron-responsive transcriptional regulator RirA n=1 Tax=Aureimonas psammosilenae TaxID=2495496 RepID=UPI001260A563|nr:iron-responsive transcriptional regulator RirA [Aureimonas psammosilenae]
MRLTRQTNHAVRMLMFCALRGEKLSRVGEIALAYSVSELFLFKILQPLVEAGFVETVRGRNGGIRLRKPAEAITLRAVVEVTEENFSLAECFETGSDCPLIGDCSLNGALHEALEAFLEVLASYTIADLVADHASVGVRLGFPVPNTFLASA